MASAKILAVKAGTQPACLVCQPASSAHLPWLCPLLSLLLKGFFVNYYALSKLHLLDIYGLQQLQNLTTPLRCQ